MSNKRHDSLAVYAGPLHFPFDAFPTRLWKTIRFFSPGSFFVSTPAPIVPDANLGLHEIPQIMGAAHAICEEQLTVEQQIHIEEARAESRVRWLARLTVWCEHKLRVLALVGVMGVAAWIAFFIAAIPWSSASRSADVIRQAEQAARSVLDRLNVTARGEAARQAVDVLTQEFHAAEATENMAAIEQSRQRMAELLATLNEGYSLQIVSGAGRDSAVSRHWNQGGADVQSYYVIVEARNRDGRILPQSVQDAETGRSKSVLLWGEQVPKEVYDRLKSDESSGGVLKESHFADKPRGSLRERVLLPGSDGKPLQRGMRITQW